MYLRMYVRMYVCTYVRMYARLYRHTYVRVTRAGVPRNRKRMELVMVGCMARRAILRIIRGACNDETLVTLYVCIVTTPGLRPN